MFQMGIETYVHEHPHACVCVCVCARMRVHEPIAEMTGAEGGKGNSHFKKVTLSLRQWEISKGILAKSDEVRLGSRLWGWLSLFLPLLTFPYVCFALLLSLTQSSNFLTFTFSFDRSSGSNSSPVSLNPTTGHQNNSPADVLVLLLPCVTSRL